MQTFNIIIYIIYNNQIITFINIKFKYFIIEVKLSVIKLKNYVVKRIKQNYKINVK